MNTMLRAVIVSLLGLASGPLLAADRTDTGFAIGGGAQIRLGAFALRGEYERFNAAGARPSLWAIGATWTFL